MKIHILLIVVFCSFEFSYGQEFSSVEWSSADYSNFVNELMGKEHIPGLSIALIRNRVVIFSGGIGVQDLTSHKPVSDSTQFDAASMSKPLTAFVAMILYERGLLDIDKPLSTYCLYPKLAKNPGYKQLTAWMVMTHTSGLPNWGDSFIYEPGQQFGYSGEGFVYLGRAIEKITGKTLDKVMKDEILEPLNMEHSSFIWTPDYSDHIASGHDSDGGVIPKKRITEAHGAGTLLTTAKDYARFVIAIQNGEILSTKTYNEIFKRHVVADNWDADERIPNLFWGLGWGIQTNKYEDQYFHMGNNRYWRGYVVFSRNTGNGIVYFGNSEKAHEIAEELVELVFTKPQWGLRLVK